MGFRHRLALFLVVTLVSVQALTAFLAYSYLHSSLVARTKSELAAATGVFMRHLNVLSERATDDVEVLSLDYALRQAIAQNDYHTEISALRNHGHRVGAARMMLIGLDGSIKADTGAAISAHAPFTYAGLLDDAASNGQRTALVAVNGRIDWIVIVPVRAPVTIAFIAAFIPVDDALLDKVQAITSQPHSVLLATRRDERWLAVARSGATPGIALLPSAHFLSGRHSAVSRSGGHEYLSETASLETAPGSAPVAVLLGYSLDQAMAPYRALLLRTLVIILLSLIPAALIAMFIAGGVSRPIEQLAANARRIDSGDYAAPEPLPQKDELGDLSHALIAMTHSIAEREAALTTAVASLEVARSDAVRANEAKSQFLANMSHELRTPLNAIVGFGEMLHQQVLGPLGVARYGEYARDICESGQKLLALVSRMLDLADMEKGKLEIAHAPFSAAAVLQQSIAVTRALAVQAGVELTARVESASWPDLTGDSEKLREALSGIFHNGVKFTPAGGTLDISAERSGSEILIRVVDSGVGMSPEDVAVVTQPFHRLRSALDGLHQGAGLGLPFAKAIAELHGGRLDISSNPGIGTVVEIRLPLGCQRLEEAA